MTYLEKHYDEIFKKYSLDELSKDIENYKYGEGRLNKILAHFFEEEMWKCCGKKTTISPNGRFVVPLFRYEYLTGIFRWKDELPGEIIAVCPFPKPYSGYSKKEITEDINRIFGGDF